MAATVYTPILTNESAPLFTGTYDQNRKSQVFPNFYNLQLLISGWAETCCSAIKLRLQAAIPTGKYDHLNSKKFETDAAGSENRALACDFYYQHNSETRFSGNPGYTSESLEVFGLLLQEEILLNLQQELLPSTSICKRTHQRF